MADILFGRCSCGTGNLTVYHLQYECPLTQQPKEFSEADRETIRLIINSINEKRRLSKMIKPTIGRVVWYWDTLEQRNQEGAQAHAAIVTHVWNDSLVNLALFTANGDSLPATSVTLYQGEGEPPTERFCEWMPYQKEQAAAQAQTPAHVSISKQIEKFNSLPAVAPPPPPPAPGEVPHKDGTGVA